MKSKSYIPEGYHTATPYLVLDGAARAIEFYKKAFGAKEIMRLDMPDGKIGHMEMQIGDSRIMFADEFPEWGNRGPKAIGGSASSIMLYVPDCDAVFNQAVAAGAKPTMSVADQFYGDRCGKVEDPFGHNWMIATNKEELTPEEVKERMAKSFGGG